MLIGGGYGRNVDRVDSLLTCSCYPPNDPLTGPHILQRQGGILLLFAPPEVAAVGGGRSGMGPKSIASEELPEPAAGHAHATP